MFGKNRLRLEIRGDSHRSCSNPANGFLFFELDRGFLIFDGRTTDDGTLLLALPLVPLAYGFCDVVLVLFNIILTCEVLVVGDLFVLLTVRGLFLLFFPGVNIEVAVRLQLEL